MRVIARRLLFYIVTAILAALAVAIVLLVLYAGGGGYGGHEGLLALTQRTRVTGDCASRRGFARHDPDADASHPQ